MGIGLEVDLAQVGERLVALDRVGDDPVPRDVLGRVIRRSEAPALLAEVPVDDRIADYVLQTFELSDNESSAGLEGIQYRYIYITFSPRNSPKDRHS